MSPAAFTLASEDKLPEDIAREKAASVPDPAVLNQYFCHRSKYLPPFDR
jgi:hypothetical protein